MNIVGLEPYLRASCRARCRRLAGRGAEGAGRRRALVRARRAQRREGVRPLRRHAEPGLRRRRGGDADRHGGGRRDGRGGRSCTRARSRRRTSSRRRAARRPIARRLVGRAAGCRTSSPSPTRTTPLALPHLGPVLLPAAKRRGSFKLPGPVLDVRSTVTRRAGAQRDAVGDGARRPSRRAACGRARPALDVVPRRHAVARRARGAGDVRRRHEADRDRRAASAGDARAARSAGLRRVAAASARGGRARGLVVKPPRRRRTGSRRRSSGAAVRVAGRAARAALSVRQLDGARGGVRPSCRARRSSSGSTVEPGRGRPAAVDAAAAFEGVRSPGAYRARVAPRTRVLRATRPLGRHRVTRLLRRLRRRRSRGAPPAPAARFAVGVARRRRRRGRAAVERALGRAAAARREAAALVVEARSRRRSRASGRRVRRARSTRRAGSRSRPNDPLVAAAVVSRRMHALRLLAGAAALRRCEVAVIDSGVDGGHPELEGRIADCKSFVGGSGPTTRQGTARSSPGSSPPRRTTASASPGSRSRAELLVAKVVRGRRHDLARGRGRGDPLGRRRRARASSTSASAACGTRATRPRHVLAARGGAPSSTRTVGASWSWRRSETPTEAPATPWRYASYPAALPHVLGVSALARDGSSRASRTGTPSTTTSPRPATEIVSTFPRALTAERPACPTRATRAAARTSTGRPKAPRSRRRR